MNRIAAGTAVGLTLVVGAVTLLLAATGYMDRSPNQLFASGKTRVGISALFFSGDKGLRIGMGSATPTALAAHGVRVLGVNSSSLFRTHRTRAETSAAVAQAIRDALRLGGNQQLVLIGHSYGADVLQTGLVDLPAKLRRHIEAVVLVVPGRDVYFRADPTGLSYRGMRDSDGAATIRALHWTQLTCIYGATEQDSACPAAAAIGATLIAMPGGHALNRDSSALSSNVLAAVARVSPSLHL